MDRGAWQATVYGVSTSQTQLSMYAQSNIGKNKLNISSFIWFNLTALKSLQKNSSLHFS